MKKKKTLFFLCSLTLLTPLLFTISSCSINKNEIIHKQQTKVVDKINVNNLNINQTVDEFYNQNKNNLSSFIFKNKTNIFLGDYNINSANDINVCLVSKTKEILKLKITILPNCVYDDNSKLNSEPISFETTLFGFKQILKPQTIIKTNINIVDIIKKEISIDQFNLMYPDFKAFVFNNLDYFVTNSLIESINDFEINNLIFNENINFQLIIKPNFWINKLGEVQNSNLETTININNFTKNNNVEPMIEFVESVNVFKQIKKIIKNSEIKNDLNNFVFNNIKHFVVSSNFEITLKDLNVNILNEINNCLSIQINIKNIVSKPINIINNIYINNIEYNNFYIVNEFKNYDNNLYKVEWEYKLDLNNQQYNQINNSESDFKINQLDFDLLPFNLVCKLINKNNNQIIDQKNYDIVFDKSNYNFNQKLKVFVARFGAFNYQNDLINILDLNLSYDELRQCYNFMINKMFSLFSYLTLKHGDKNSFENQVILKQDNKIVYFKNTSNVSKILDYQKAKQNANAISNLLEIIFANIPNYENDIEYLYYVYQLVCDWYAYNNKMIGGGQILPISFIEFQGVCESYAKLSNILLNAFGINTIYQLGTIKTGSKSEAHVWTKFNINNHWFNFDTTWADTTNSNNKVVSNKSPTYKYLCFPDSFEATTRLRFNNWYIDNPIANTQINEFANYVTLNKNISSRKISYLNNWYYVLNNKIYFSKLNLSEQKILYEFNDPELANQSIWQNNNTIYFVDYFMNQYYLMSYDLSTNTLNKQFKKLDDKPIKIYIDVHNNKLVINLQNQTNFELQLNKSDFLNINKFNDFSESKKIKVIKSLCTINMSWFNLINCSKNINDLNFKNYTKYLYQLIDAITLNKFDQNIYNQMLNFKSNVHNDLNK